MELLEVVNTISEALVAIDASEVPFRNYKPGVGPYGKPQLVRSIAQYFNEPPAYKEKVITKRAPNLLIPNEWAIEFKIAWPFGDNGDEAENWSVNLLHPYYGNISTIGDCLKLVQLKCKERLAVVVIGYEHSTARINLSPLIDSFELIAKHINKIKLSKRVETRRDHLVHPVHQSLRVFAWEVFK